VTEFGAESKAARRIIHLMKLLPAFVDRLRRGDCEYGGWGLDDKRPFGNSDVAGDIAKIIGLQVDGDTGITGAQREYCDGLYDDLPEYLRYRLFGGGSA